MNDRKICCHCHKNSAVTSYEKKGSVGAQMEYYCLPCYEKLFLHVNEEKGAQRQTACPYCGTSVEQYQKTKIVGCSYCYQTMYSDIVPVIVKMQGDCCGHRGKKPPLSTKDEAVYENMRFEVNAQRYEYRTEREQSERFMRQKREIEKLIEFLADNPIRQQEYKDKLDRMERRGAIEEEIVW